MKHIQYQTQGTCSVLIDVTADDENGIQEVAFLGGCSGNLQGICRLVKGQKIDDVIDKLDGIRCGDKPNATHRSPLRAPLELAPCPDQLCRALEELKRVN
ncbi:MAG: TIGR03905 family TSCPD domain-containing protein [Bacteroidales bacterium]|nr:TIGR03905 family TSCPD domain-containing protein [Bacteroidales bacterium]